MKKQLDVNGALMDVQVAARLVQAVVEADVIKHVQVLAYILVQALVLVHVLVHVIVLHINEDFV